MSGDVAGGDGGNARFDYVHGSRTHAVRVVNGVLFITGNRDYWMSKAHALGAAGAPLAREISGSWLAVVSGCECLRAELAGYRPERLAVALGAGDWRAGAAGPDSASFTTANASGAVELSVSRINAPFSVEVPPNPIPATPAMKAMIDAPATPLGTDATPRV